jgi:gliding motility-associated-like protein
MIKHFLLMSALTHAALLFGFNSLKVAANELQPQFNQHPGFVENLGQLKRTDGKNAEEVVFYGNLPGGNIFFTKSAVVYDFVHLESAAETANRSNKSSLAIPLNRLNVPTETRKHYRVDMQFEGTSEDVVISGFNPTGGKNNYYFGNNPSQWVTDARLYNGVRYAGIYPGIDLVIYFKQDGSGIKYDFEIKEGANPSLIQYSYKGATSLRLNDSGEIIAETPEGTIREDAPYTYQLHGNKKTTIASSFVLNKGVIGFNINEFDRGRKLIIDPSVLVWSTYFGGNGADERSMHLVTDPSGDVVMTGRTLSTDFPVSPGASQTTFGGGSQRDGFIAKFNAAGNRLWCTYAGGSGIDEIRSCDTDASGNIFVIGTTGSANLPVLNPGGGAFFQATNLAIISNPNNITVILGKYSPTGQMIWSTYFGGSVGENGIDIWVDGNNEVIVSGNSGSPDFPVTPGAAQTQYGGPLTGTVFGDVFLAKFGNNGARQWATYLGGPLDELGYSVTADNNGEIFLSGQTKGNFPVTPGAFQTTYGGGDQDMLVARFSSTGVKNWVSYYGGTGVEQGTDILFHDNFVYIGGYSSANMPGPSAGVAQPNSGGGLGDGVLAKWSPNAGPNQVIWRTFTGGSGDDGIDEVTLNPSGNIVTGGWSSSTNYPVTPNAFQTAHGGGYDGHVTTFDADGQRLCATYFGGSFQTDNVYALTVVANGDVVISGNTGSTTAQGFPITPGAFQPTKSNGLDSYLARISEIPDAPDANFTANPNAGCSTPLVVNFTNTSVSNNTCYSNTTWQWSFPGGNPSSSNVETPPAVTYNNTGTFTASLKVTNASGSDSTTQTITITIGETVNAGPDKFLCLGDSVLLTATGAANYSWSPAAGLSGTTGASVFAKPLVTTSYVVTGSGGSCPPTTDTVLVTVADSLPDPKIAGSSYCPGKPINPLQVTNAADYDVTWYTDEALTNQVGTGEFYTPTGPGSWYVIMKQSGCESNVASFTILEQTIETKIEANVSNAVKPFDLIAENKSVNAVNCSWFLNDEPFDYTAGSVYTIEEPGDYELKLICKNASGCEDVDSLLFTVIDDKVELIIPNVFTPDNDAQNDLFAFSTSGIKDLSGRIFNRWGKEVYSWEGILNYWDGTINGNEATDGVYFYVVEATDIFDKKLSEKGTVTLIRGGK